MGSIEVFDYKLNKWVPYVSPSVEEWRKRFEDSNSGKTPTHVLVQKLKDQLKEKDEHIRSMEMEMKKRIPQVTQITQVAQAVEIARSEVKQERKKAKPRKKSSSSLPKRYRDLNYF